MKRNFLTTLAALLATICGATLCCAQTVIDSMDEITFKASSDKAKFGMMEGKTGKALRFNFEADSKSAFISNRLRGEPSWDKAAGFSFWLKGDGSENFGGLQLIWNEDYALRYDYAFPLSNKEWHKVVVPWRDLVPVLPAATALIGADGNAPSKLSQLWFGKWWYWGNYPAHSYSVDDIRLEAEIPLDNTDYQPKAAPLARVQARLKAGQPITIVTMGDSLTDFRHWANRETNWPTLLKNQLKAKFGCEVTIINPAIGGTQLRQNVALIPTWISQAPQPDLVTVCFGFNDWDAGMHGEQFYAALKDAIDRIRRVTGGKADVLLITTAPSVERWDTLAELAEAVRRAAREKNTGLADTYTAFHATPQPDAARFFVHDKVHLSPAGHGLVAQNVLQALSHQAR
jgi:lysophospholipase L1-like esterase